MTRLLSCIVTHDRLELTRRTIISYLNTVDLEYRLVVVDNASSDGTREMLRDLDEIDELILLDRNVYPGAACNLGWLAAATWGADLLHRSDNDVEYRPGWCDEVERSFEDLSLGQLGLLEERYEAGCGSVGGNCVLRRELWDAGLRWDATPWGPGVQEDSRMSAAVRAMGYEVARVGRDCVRHLGWEFDAYSGYYAASCAARGLDEGWLRTHFDRMRAL